MTEWSAPLDAWQPVAAGPSWSRVRRILPRVVVTLLLVVSVAGGWFGYQSWAYAAEMSGRVLPGAVVAGIDIGGLRTDEALSAVLAVVAPELDREVRVRLGDQVWTSTPRLLGSASDAREAVAAAADHARAAGWQDLLRLRWRNQRLTFDRSVTVAHVPATVRAWVDEIAEQVNVAPTDARLEVAGGWVQVIGDQPGRVVDTEATAAALVDALDHGGSEVELVVHPVPAAIPASTFDQVLLLRQREHKLYLYQNGEITHSWLVATGTGEYPTPTGIHQVVQKRYLPTWVNPSPRGWGKDMPARIAPGPSNPLGLRALNWSVPNIRFHGTAAVDSLGRDASHGCVRLSNRDVVQLYNLVREGATIVSIR